MITMQTILFSSLAKRNIIHTFLKRLNYEMLQIGTKQR